jgi:uncharacterized spore protein YtfJ
MNVEELLAQSKGAMTVKRVFGDPYERDGITVIPAASVRGTGGGGGGGDVEGNGGSGGGFAMAARPVGAFVIRDGDVTWRPAYDATRVALLGELVAAVALFTLRSVLKVRAKRRR